MRQRSSLILALLATLSVGLLGLIWFGYVAPLRALGHGLDAPDAMIAGYDRHKVELLRQAYLDTPAAGDILRAMHLGPDMILPAAGALLIALTLFKLLPGRLFYGRLMSKRHALAACVLPLAFMLADYAENLASLMFFPPATPDAGTIDQLANLLPWLTSLKFMFLLISLLVVARFLPGHLSGDKSPES